MEDIMLGIQYMRKNEIYCIRLILKKKFSSHMMLVNILKLNMMEYQEILKNYNSIKHPQFSDSSCVYFENKEDALRAKEYLEGLFVMDKLTR